MTDHLHPVHLPFTADQLAEHLAPGKADGAGYRHADIYLRSLERTRLHAEAVARGSAALPAQPRSARQIEKDERFWIAAALLSLFYAEPITDRARRYAELLRRAGLQPPATFPTWTEALSGASHLYFEVTLPSPLSYLEWLRPRLAERMPIPHVRDTASSRLEGNVQVDAMLLAPDTGVAAMIEAKVLTDLSTDLAFDMARNQLARTIDVMLEENPTVREPLSRRRPDRSYLVLLTPELMCARKGRNPLAKSRLYGWLMPAYQDPTDDLLHTHLPHRAADELREVPARLGWASWEDCNAVLPNTCAWLTDRARSGIDHKLT